MLAAAPLLALLLAALIPATASAASSAAPTRYSLVKNCYLLQSAQTGRFVAQDGAGYVATAGSGNAEGFRMQATALGRYLFYGLDRDFLATSNSAVSSDAEPSNGADWTVDGSGGTFTVSNKFIGRDLAVDGAGKLVPVSSGSAGKAGQFSFKPAEGCPKYPEITTNVKGKQSVGFPRYGETEGLLEGHMHHMAFKFLAGAHCGKPWDRFGVPYALVDCIDHQPNGCAAILETALNDGKPCHDPAGWPDFTDWPAPRSLTHEQSYYKWLERSWRSGLRVFVNLMVQNRALCELYPLKGENDECDDTKTVDIEIKEAYKLQDYIDAQEGGPGKGWYRIVKNPFQARKVINQGKLAVVLGMEVSEPFDCRLFAGVPTCDREQITRELDHLYDQGVRQLEITNKFDNALTGVAGDDGSTGTLVNSGNFYATGRFWDLETCTGPPEEHDRTPTGVEVHNDDLLLANAVQALIPGGVLPVYPEPPLCNTRGLTDLGEHAIRQIAKRGMIFDPDHMSVEGRDQALNLIDSLKYSGLISSHTWSTPAALPRIYRRGGLVTPYAGESEAFVDRWRELDSAFKGRQYWGVGYGADQNGFGGQGGPRGADVPNPVSYPFKSFNGEQTIYKQKSGNKTYDINTSGVSHYGLYPDWVEDLRMLAGDKIVDDLSRGPEAYLQMWERAEGVTRVRCPNWRGGFSRKGLAGKLKLGDTAKKALYRAGQPVKRERAWKWCTKRKKKSKRALGGRRNVVGVFDPKGRMRMALSTLQENPAAGIGRGDRKRQLQRKAKSIGGGIYVRKAGRGRVYVYGTKGKKVSFAGVAAPQIARSNGKLKRYVKLSGLR